jgi:hypothetical protein
MKLKSEKSKKFIYLHKLINHSINVSKINYTLFLAIATGTLGKPDYQGPSSVKCAFGKFGSSLGMYINSTTVLCLSPTISDRPEDFATETVFVGVAMNGQDFETETSSVQVTFVGTGDSSAIWHFLASLLLFSLMILGIVMLCIGLYNYC